MIYDIYRFHMLIEHSTFESCQRRLKSRVGLALRHSDHLEKLLRSFGRES